MRIISGNLKGKKIFLPKDKKTRPLRDLVKESIFNLIKHSNKFDCNIENSNILDLFCGTGSFGLECISRNAKKVTFVENYRDALDILKKNITSLKVDKKYEIFEEDCFDFFKLEKRFIKLIASSLLFLKSSERTTKFKTLPPFDSILLLFSFVPA